MVARSLDLARIMARPLIERCHLAATRGQPGRGANASLYAYTLHAGPKGEVARVDLDKGPNARASACVRGVLSKLDLRAPDVEVRGSYDLSGVHSLCRIEHVEQGGAKWLDRTLELARPRFRACYEKRLESKPDQKGTLAFSFKAVDRAGVKRTLIEDITLKRSGSLEAELEPCLRTVLSQLELGVQNPLDEPNRGELVLEPLGP